MAAIFEIQQSLSTLAGHSTPPYMEAQQAANSWAGTTGLELLAALNCKNQGVTTVGALTPKNNLDFNKVCNALASTTGKEAQDALSNLAGGGHT